MQCKSELDTFGRRLLYLRQSSHKTLQEVSDSTGISRSNLGKYEKDEVNSSADAIIGLCDFYDVSADWLLRGIEPQTQKIEATFDPDLKHMVDILKELMESDNQNLRGWTIIQFENTFKQYCAAYGKKD